MVIEKENKILFVKRSMKKKTLPGILAFPSGTKEETEEIFDTARRESFEELGVEVVPKKIIARKPLPEFSSELLFVKCYLKNGEPYIKDKDEISEILWMSFDEFFDSFEDEEIGHGLQWLRKNREVLK